MTADSLPVDPEVELDRCIDQLLATGAWEVRIPRGRARSEIDGLMRVAALLRALARHIARPTPGEKDRVWASVSSSLNLWRVTVSRQCRRLELSRQRTGFRPI